MKRLMLILLMALGMITSGFSQISYPARILFQSDTLAAITKPQLIKINRALNDYTHLKQSYRLLQVDLSAADSIIRNYRRITEEQNRISMVQEKKFTEQTNYYEEVLSESLKRQKRKSRLTSIGVGVGGTLLGVLLGVLLSK